MFQNYIEKNHGTYHFFYFIVLKDCNLATMILFDLKTALTQHEPNSILKYVLLIVDT